MAVHLMHPELMFCIGIVVILLSVVLGWALISYKKDRRKPFLALAVALVLPISGLGVFECIMYRDFQYRLHYDILQYTVDLGSASGLPEEVILPASNNVQLTGLVKVALGNPTVKSVNTLYGPGFLVLFSGRVRLSGRLDTTEGIGKHDLTMGSKYSQEVKGPLYWISYTPADGSSFNCSIDLRLYHEALDWWETTSFSGFLNASWHEYAFKHKAMS